MRIIAVRTLKEYWDEFPRARQALLSWYEEVEIAEWSSPNELKSQYRHASILNAKRVVFNIHGNRFRLIVDIEFRLKIFFVVWFGSHEACNRINAEKISYDKADKK